MRNEILKKHLEAIDFVLAAEAPNLQPLTQGALRDGLVSAFGGRSGEIADDIYKATMSKEDARAILNVLTAAVKQYGWKRKFKGLQINMLANDWKNICTALESPKPQ